MFPPQGSDEEGTPSGFQSPNSISGQSRAQSTSDICQVSRQIIVVLKNYYHNCLVIYYILSV